jgi:predicted membrane protein
MGIGKFFEGVNNTMTNWGGTFYMGMFVLTILMMVLLFSWLNSKDADNSLIIGTAVLLFIPAFVFLTLWMSSVWAYSPLAKMKKALADAIIKGQRDLATAFAKALGPDGARAVLESMRAEYSTQVESILQEMDSESAATVAASAAVETSEYY